MATDEPTLGDVIRGPAFRDAIHIAVAPMIAATPLSPGDHVGISTKDAQKAIRRAQGENIGIVDPYLTRPVEPGEKFWLFLYPRTVTGLRHQWSHPAFADEVNVHTPQAASRAWIDYWAATTLTMDGDKLIRDALNYLDGDYPYFKGRSDDESYKNVDWTPFWQHSAVVTGRTDVPEGDSPPYSCAC